MLERRSFVKSSNAASYRIGAVAKRTGLSTHTIRVWERRYGAVEPQRTAGGTREYSEDDVERLRLLNTLTQSGHSIGGIAGLATEELVDLLRTATDRGFVADDATNRHTAVLGSILDAIEELDVSKAERILLNTSAVLGPLPMIFDVIAPLVEAVGDRWESGQFRIAHEHAATAALRTLLGQFLANRSFRSGMSVAVVATLSGERHELGALMASFIAAARGFDVVYLGPDLPVEEILHVVGSKGGAVVMLSLVNSREEAAVKMLVELKASMPANVDLLVGGRSASQFEDVLTEEERVTSLHDLYDRLGNRVSLRVSSSTLQ